jgi:hypothetical protein
MLNRALTYVDCGAGPESSNKLIRRTVARPRSSLLFRRDLQELGAACPQSRCSSFRSSQCRTECGAEAPLETKNFLRRIRGVPGRRAITSRLAYNSEEYGTQLASACRGSPAQTIFIATEVRLVDLSQFSTIQGAVQISTHTETSGVLAPWLKPSAIIGNDLFSFGSGSDRSRFGSCVHTLPVTFHGLASM